MADTRQPTFGVFIGSSGSTNEITRAVESVTIEDHDRLADKAVVRINDSLHLAADALRPGQRIEINLGWQNGEHAVMFAGRIHQPDVHETSGAQGMVITALDYSTVMHQEARDGFTTPADRAT